MKRPNPAKALEPDEIFLDSKNLPGFEQERLEGRMERPLPGKTFWYLGFALLALGGFLWYKSIQLQVFEGKVLKLRADQNRLRIIPLWPARGLVLDRRGEILAENKSGPERYYPDAEALAHLLGYLGYPSPDFQRGITGIEEYYDKELKGKIGSKLAEVNSIGEIVSEAVEEQPQNGRNIILTVDRGLERRVYQNLKELAEERGFKGGAAVMLDVRTGGILALSSYPSFDPNLFSEGGPAEKIEHILRDASKPLFNRAVSGLYAAGSVFKPILALAALEEGIISPEKQILSTGFLSVPNPFRPNEPSVFYDWKAHGWVNMRQAIAVSSNVYFYTLGGGYEEIKGLGVKKIQEWARKFGLGEKTGLDFPGEKEGFIPGPEWKEKVNPADPIWRIGDTYNLSIGQGNLQVTPLQMAVYTAALANGGKILEPHLLKQITEGEKIIFEEKTKVKRELAVKPENLQVIREGMRFATEIGTAQSLAGLGLKVAGKTGTSEIGSGQVVNSWFIGFFPYENPKIAMAVVLEGGSAANLVGAPAASRRILEWLLIYRPELLR